MGWRSVALMLSRSARTALGNDVTIAGTTGYGILRSPEESVMDGMVFVSDYLLELPVDTWPSLAEGALVDVDGVLYQSREQGRINRDGSSLFVPLTKARAGLLGVFVDGVFEDGVFSADGSTPAGVFAAGVFEDGVYVA